MRKSLICLALSLIMVLGTIGMASAYTAGTYEATTTGHNAPITLAVTVNDSAIEKIDVTVENETIGVGKVALETMTQRIVDSQSLAVDTLSGATVTSDAAKAAAAAALAQATGATAAEAKLADGTYTAEAYGFEMAVSNKLIVTIEGGKITKIEAQNAEDNGGNGNEEGNEEDNAAAENKLKAVSEAFEQTYDEKTRKVYEAIVALGFSAYGWIAEIADTYAIYAVWSDEKGDYVYTRFDVAWNGEEVTVSNPTEVKPAFVAKDAPAPEGNGGNEEAETLRSENESLRSENESLRAKLNESVEKPVGNEPGNEAPKGNQFLAAVHKRQ